MREATAFHRAFGIPIKPFPAIPYQPRVELRRRLIQEEMQEVEEEFSIILTRLRADGYTSAMLMWEDVARLAKELADLRYVIDGTALEFGIPLDAVYSEVHRSNMSKLGADGKPIRRHDGKVLKGPNYSEADVMSVFGIIEGSIATP